VHPSDATAALTLLAEFVARQPKTMSVEGGADILVSDQDYDWTRVVLEPALQTAVKTDFETFWNRRDWFLANRLPYKRGYLLYGPPGNGKTSIVRVMVSHPKVSAFSIDFGSRMISNCSLTRLFERAALAAPAVVVFEDLDRYFDERDKNDEGVDLPHLLNCLDGLQSQDGVVVVATANDPRRLDPALLRRPGRFDRIAHLPNPVLTGRREYFHRMISSWDSETLDCLARLSDGLSFAQLRESYILAGQFAFLRGDEVNTPDMQEAILQVRAQFTGKVAGPLTPEVGFAHA
jgi:SpoVK/Ycf46/Vps4 family AAA+-type ATPase